MLNPGDRAALTHVFGADDVADWAALAGAPPQPGELPELLVWALFSRLLGMTLPGLGTNYLKQEGRFTGAARVGDTLHAEVVVTRVRPEKKLVDLATRCSDDHGHPLFEGRALVWVGDVAGAV